MTVVHFRLFGFCSAFFSRATGASTGKSSNVAVKARPTVRYAGHHKQVFGQSTIFSLGKESDKGICPALRMSGSCSGSGESSKLSGQSSPVIPPATKFLAQGTARSRGIRSSSGAFTQQPLSYYFPAEGTRSAFALSATVMDQMGYQPYTGAPISPEVDDTGGDKNKTCPVGEEGLEVVVLGLSHHNAKVEVREKLAIPEAMWNEAATKLCEFESISEAAVLSTCNRFEIYLAGKNQYEVVRDAMKFLNDRAGGSLDQATLRRNLFMLSGDDAVWHLLRVSAGLDSLVVGEGQILAQVKKSHEHSVEGSGPAGKVISRMLNTAVTAGKRVRAETGISKGAVSISSAAAEFTATKLDEDCQISSGMKDAEIAIIGAGKMSRLLLVHLESQGVNKVTIINRSFDRIDELQQEFPNIQITKKLMSEMWDVLQTADVVYPSTSSESTIIDPEPLAECMKKRTRAGGLHIVDISVPRNVHAGCSHVANVCSYNVDDLKTVVQKNTAKRRREMIEAENILREEQSKFRLWQHALGAIPTIAKLQEKAENLRKEEMSKAAKKLAALSAKDLEIVEKITKGIVAKLLHGPMCHLRQQHEGDATRAAITQVQKAFQLEH